jgi:hypothetical protein
MEWPQIMDENAKWKLDGESEGIELSAEELAALNQIADALIPPGDGFPAPSSVRIAEDFLVRYVTPADRPTVHYPQLGEAELRDFLAELVAGLAKGVDLVDTLRQTESKRQALFEKLRGLVYYGYYSRVEVVAAIRSTLEAGRDYRGAPQPCGYLDVTDQWRPSMFEHHRGTYTRTADVRQRAKRVVPKSTSE